MSFHTRKMCTQIKLIQWPEERTHACTSHLPHQWLLSLTQIDYMKEERRNQKNPFCIQAWHHFSFHTHSLSLSSFSYDFFVRFFTCCHFRMKQKRQQLEIKQTNRVSLWKLRLEEKRNETRTNESVNGMVNLGEKFIKTAINERITKCFGWIRSGIIPLLYNQSKCGSSSMICLMNTC